MLKIFMRIGALSLVALFLLSGCLISILVLVDEEISTTTVPGPFFAEFVDVTDEEDWIDHEDDIEFVNWVSFDLWLTNPSSIDITFEGYIDDADNPACSDVPCAMTKTRILRPITIPGSSTRHITAGESLGFIENMPLMKTLAQEGRFNFYGVSTGGTFVVDSGRVVVAVVVSGS